MFEERRRQKRVDVNIPIRVKGADVWGNRFEEVTKSINVTSDGAYFPLKHNIKPGSMLQLSLPLPRHLQKGAAPKAVYQTIGLVVRVEIVGTSQTSRVGVKFRTAKIKQYRSES